MRTPEEISRAIAALASAGSYAVGCGDMEIARYALKIIQCLNWVQGEDAEFSKMLRDSPSYAERWPVQ